MCPCAVRVRVGARFHSKFWTDAHPLAARTRVHSTFRMASFYSCDECSHVFSVRVIRAECVALVSVSHSLTHTFHCVCSECLFRLSEEEQAADKIDMGIDQFQANAGYVFACCGISIVLIS